MKTNQILETGRNCWRIARADKAAFLIDGAAYFEALSEALPKAKQQILILAWDLHSRLRLVPARDHDDEILPLGDLLNQIVKNQRELDAYVLDWDFSLLIALSREWLPIYKLDWRTHRRLRFRMDDHAPLGSSHHQKVVVIDDAIAFAGGLDLTRGRWDTPEHRPDDPRRGAVDGTPLPIRPYHDVQMAVSGPAAAALGDLARQRWQRATGEKLSAPRVGNDPWPSRLQSDLEMIDVAIVRTAPPYGDQKGIREVEQLYVDVIAAAEDYIYFENQYFTSATVVEALLNSLADSDGPEIIINLPVKTQGWLAEKSLDIMRVNLIKKLRAHDRYNRLTFYYPYKPGLGDLPINLHAKIMIADDRFARVGSSNLNNRSMGLDTECDLAIEAGQDQPEVGEAIRHFRNRLLGEHLDVAPEKVDEAVAHRGSLGAAIEALRDDGRTLNLLEPTLPPASENAVEAAPIVDPERPIDVELLLDEFVPAEETRFAGKRVFVWVVVIGFLAGAAAAWRFTPLGEWLDIEALVGMASHWKESAFAPLFILTAFVVGGLLMVPVTVLIIAAVLIFGPLVGFLYALAGTVSGAVAGYGVGASLGRDMIRRVAGRRLNKVSRQLGRRGLLTTMVVRIVPVAPFTVVNLVAGASHISFRDFLVGSLLGVIPGILGIALLTDRVKASVQTPGWDTLTTLALVGAGVITAGYFLSRVLMDRVGKAGEGDPDQAD